MANWEAPHDPMPCHQGCDPRVDRGVGRAGSSKNVPGDQRLAMIARARCRLATSRRSALADRDAAGESGGRPRSWSHPNNRWGRIGGPTSYRIPRMASALGCSLFDSMCLEIGRRNVAFEQAQQTRIGRRSNRRTPVRSGSFPSAHLSDAQLLPNSRDGKANAGAS